jgi:hypothetical protein
MGKLSNTYEFIACLKPSKFNTPYRIDSTISSITVGWDEPLSNGGCPITGYAVFIDDGTGMSVFNEMNSVNDPLVRDIPSLNQLKITS